MMEHDDNDVLKFSFCFIVSNSVSGFFVTRVLYTYHTECCKHTIQSVVYILYRVLYTYYTECCMVTDACLHVHLSVFFLHGSFLVHMTPLIPFLNSLLKLTSLADLHFNQILSFSHFRTSFAFLYLVSLVVPL